MVAPGQKFETFHGCVLTLSQQGQDFFINNAEILDADILVSNGVIHVISNLLLPAEDCERLTPEDTEAPSVPATDPTPMLPTAEPVSNTTDTMETDAPDIEAPIEVDADADANETSSGAENGTELGGSETAEETQQEGTTEAPPTGGATGGATSGADAASSAFMRGTSILSVVAVSALLPFLFA
jgi:Fasciclin domain